MGSAELPGGPDPDRSPDGSSGPLPWRALAVYTLARIAIVAICFGVLFAIGFRSWALVLGALLLGALVSAVALRRQRSAVSGALAGRRGRPRPPRRDVFSQPGRAPVPRQGDEDDDDPGPDEYADDPYGDDPYADPVGPAAEDPGRGTGPTGVRSP